MLQITCCPPVCLGGLPLFCFRYRHLHLLNCARRSTLCVCCIAVGWVLVLVTTLCGGRGGGAAGARHGRPGGGCPRPSVRCRCWYARRSGCTPDKGQWRGPPVAGAIVAIVAGRRGRLRRQNARFSVGLRPIVAIVAVLGCAARRRPVGRAKSRRSIYIYSRPATQQLRLWPCAAPICPLRLRR